MDLATQLREKGDFCALIFVTSSDAFAVASYDVQAAYYLLKPLDTNKLTKVLDSIQIKRAQDTRYIEVICDRTLLRVPVKSILYADTFHNAVQLHTDAGVLRTSVSYTHLPVPVPTAIIRFCTGNASETAVSALSLNFATNILSTIL